MIEYGSAGQWRISKYVYNDGNRAPIATADAEVHSGSIPFELKLLSEGTIDYDGDDLDRLTRTIIEGSEGSWGEIPMPPNPMVSQSEAQQITEFILGLTDRDSQSDRLLLSGNYVTTAHERSGGAGRLGRFYTIPYQRGSYLFHSSYTDRGSDLMEGLELTGEDFILLRYPLLAPEDADLFSGKGISFTNDPGFIVSGNAPYIGF